MNRSLILAIGISVLASAAFAAQGYESTQTVKVAEDSLDNTRSAQLTEDGYDRA